MKAHRYVLLFALVALLIGSHFAARGTQVADAATSGPKRGATAKATFPISVINVDVRSPSATDSGSGSSVRPFKTIQRAVDTAESNNARGIATTIKVRRGVYREDVQISPNPHPTAAPIVIDGPASDDAIVSATNVWRNWTKTQGLIYTHAWPYNWGPAPLPDGWAHAGATPIVRRHETLFVNGHLPRQVLSLAAVKASKTPAFFVSEPNNIVYLKPASSVNMAQAVIEVGMRQGVMTVDGQRNLTIRNLRFRGATSEFGSAASLVHSRNVLLSHVTFGWNNWTGLGMYRSENVTIVHSVFDHNGSMGISGQQNQNLVLEDDENSYNNWRGAWGGMTFWENGMKLSSTHGALIRNFVAIGNQAPGLWLDTDNRNVTIENSTMKHNLVDGVVLEANQGPVTLKNSLVCGNHDSGIVDQRSNHVTLTGNRSFNNADAELLFSGAPLARSVTDWQSGVTTNVRSQYWTIRGNTFAGSGSQQLLTGGWGVTSSLWAVMSETMHSSDNRWIHSDNAEPFWIPGADERGSMSKWVAASGDTGSTFSSGRSSLTCP